MVNRRSPEMHQRNLEIVRLRMDEGKTLEIIATMYGISRQRVEQILYEYDSVLHREDTLKICAEKLYEYIINYKIENDGNSPSIHSIINKGKLFWYGRARKALKTLEKNKKIKIDDSVRPHRIFVVGGRWIPPEDD